MQIFSKAGVASLALTLLSAGVAQAQLIYDDGNATSDTFIGAPGGGQPYWSALRFTAPGLGFILNAAQFRLWASDDGSDDNQIPTLVIYRGGPDGGNPLSIGSNLVYTTVLAPMTPSVMGTTYTIAVGAIQMAPNQNFIIELRHEVRVATPIGLDDDGIPSAVGRSMYSIDGGGNYVTLPETIGGPGPDTYFIRAIGDGVVDNPLPVELSAFTGSAARGAVSLSWMTATERDNAGFSVLRDGVEIASFRSTAALRGHGTSAQASRYAYTDARVNTGRAYAYTLRSVDVSGQAHTYPASVEVTVPVEQVTAFRLSSASPNPFNPTTSLSLSLPQQAEVTATLFNDLGQSVRTLASGSFAAGTSVLTVSGDGLPTGAYLVRVSAQAADGARYLSSQRVMLVK